MKSKTLTISICSFGLALGVLFGFNIVNANSKYIKKDGFLIDSKTKTPVTEYITIDENSPLAKEKSVKLVNGIDESIVAEVTLEEFLKNQQYYEKLLTEKTNKAKEALVKAGKWEEFKEKFEQKRGATSK
ncbi:hypothetical protein [Effusibacillus lacus]|uniref:Uncharacterized protein n=1 Tax=Effusibacillus lacus TaxID=1348429 RepID=A0A292YPK1_9BACL|nr:hypothetical protein [Effusibacillus lacus]TCS74160.1 hypothetical protein EDD64_11514 [Effusibacillus lacus]GAX90841.1 hypothetical protein EFBL_2483 [Effusibacillus lacus]